MPGQGREGGVHPVPANHPLEVAVLAAGQREEPLIRTAWLAEDALPRELQEVVRPVLEPVAKGGPRLVERDGAAQEPDETREKAGAAEHLAQVDHVPGRLSRSRK